MKLLVGCEESGRVTRAFYNKGIDAWSCDLLPTSGDLPERHYNADLFQVFNAGCYDAVIAFPPFTYLTKACTANYYDPDRRFCGDLALEFVRKIWALPVEFLCIENPPGRLSREFAPPSQVIQPYFYGDDFTKTTCLWLRGFPHLPGGQYEPGHPSWVYSSASKRSGYLRSKTFPGVATTMANEWAPVLLGEKPYQGSLFYL